MTSKEKIELLTEWAVAYKNLDMSFDELGNVLGCSICDCKIYDYSFKMFESYTKTIARILNKDKVQEIEDWLSWFCYENSMGQNEMTAKAASWKKHKKIKNLRDLLKVIEE